MVQKKMFWRTSYIHLENVMSRSVGLLAKLLVVLTGAGISGSVSKAPEKYLTDLFKTIRVSEFLKIFPSPCT
jgi:hypothetical protein